MRYEFHRYCSFPEVDAPVTPIFPAVPDPKEYGAAVFGHYWFASLYVVVEGWRQLDLWDDKIDQLLEVEEQANRLRRFRNVQFHYQADGITDTRMLDMEDLSSVGWAMQLSQEFRRFFAAQNEKDSVFFRWITKCGG